MMSRFTLSLCALALLPTAPAFAIERCTRALIGNGPELGPMVCTEVEDSQRGETVSIHDVPAAEQLALHQVLHAPPLTPEERTNARAEAARRRLDAEADRLHREAASFRAKADVARQEHAAWRATHGYIGQDGSWHPFVKDVHHRHHHRRGTVVGPSRGGVFVKTKR